MGVERRLLTVVLSMALWSASAPAVSQPRQRLQVDHLPANARELFDRSMELAASSFDAQAGLIRRPVQSHSNARGAYMVRESGWYALGLLARDRNGDRALAAAILNTVLEQQYRRPGVKWFGTFKRTPEETEPLTGAPAFTTYDPNWRHFIGTTFEVILIQYADRIPGELATRLYASIDLAIEGERADGRLKESYSNIALMYGALWDFAAAHNGKPEWKTAAAAWDAEVFRLFRQHDTFYEYNSPTYYGVDLYGLALWRDYGSTSLLKSMGKTMEAALWNDIADFYQPRLRNISGPYDRSYGMDMESYVAVTGLWLRSVLPASKAPLPESLGLGTDHVADVWFVPAIVILGTEVPHAAMLRFENYAGPHLVTRRIDAQRVATAWVGPEAIWGGEATSLTKDVSATSQFHPVTAQWRCPNGRIGWIQLSGAPAMNATADGHGVTIETSGDVSFRIDAGVLPRDALSATTWRLPGMLVHVSADGSFAYSPLTLPSGETAAGITYKQVHRIRLDFDSADTRHAP